MVAKALRCGLLATVASVLLVLLSLARSATGGDGDSGQFTSNIAYPPDAATSTLSSGDHSFPAGVQVAVHNVVEVNGHEFVDSSDSPQQQHKQRHPLQPYRQLRPRNQRATIPLLSRVRLDSEPDGENRDEWDERSGSESDDRAMRRVGLSDADMRRLVQATVDSAVATDTQPQQRQPLVVLSSVADSSLIPLTLVDERDRIVAASHFQPLTPTAVPIASSPVTAVGGVGGQQQQQQQVVDQLVELISARLAQRMPPLTGLGGAGSGSTALAAGNGAAPSGGVEIALTDGAGTVVGSGTYFPHNPTGAAQPTSPLGLTRIPVPQQQQQPQQLPLQQPAANRAQSQQAASHPAAPSTAGTVAADRAGTTVSPRIVRCYDNQDDSAYCHHVPLTDKAAISSLRRHLIDTQLTPASHSHILTTGDEAANENSRLHDGDVPPRRAVIEPQHTILYSKADITQSLAPSLGVFPPVPPFMARPQSATAEVQKQAAAAAETGAPAEAAEEGAAVGAEDSGANPLAPASVGTQFRDQA